jgi:hypothetical protein
MGDSMIKLFSLSEFNYTLVIGVSDPRIPLLSCKTLLHEKEGALCTWWPSIRTAILASYLSFSKDCKSIKVWKLCLHAILFPQRAPLLLSKSKAWGVEAVLDETLLLQYITTCSKPRGGNHCSPHTQNTVNYNSNSQYSFFFANFFLFFFLFFFFFFSKLFFLNSYFFFFFPNLFLLILLFKYWPG